MSDYTELVLKAREHALSAIALAECGTSKEEKIDNIELAINDYERSIKNLRMVLVYLYRNDAN